MLKQPVCIMTRHYASGTESVSGLPFGAVNTADNRLAM